MAKTLTAEGVAAMLHRGGPTERAASAARPYSPSAIACVPRTIHPATHTRLPQYVRGHVGTIDRLCCGCHVFPDSNALGDGENPQWLYTVSFDGRRVVGRGRPIRPLQVSVDAWEPYLERA